MRLASAAFVVTLATCQPLGAAACPISQGNRQVENSAEQRRAVFRQYVGIWERGDLAELTQVLAKDYVGHPAAGDRDINGLRDRIARFRQLYPDVRFIIEDQVADGDRVATRMTAVATSTATGKRVKLIGLNISRFVGDRIIEEWPVWEEAAP